MIRNVFRIKYDNFITRAWIRILSKSIFWWNRIFLCSISRFFYPRCSERRWVNVSHMSHMEKSLIVQNLMNKSHTRRNMWVKSNLTRQLDLISFPLKFDLHFKHKLITSCWNMSLTSCSEPAAISCKAKAMCLSLQWFPNQTYKW